MAKDGLYWFHDGPDRVAQKFSTALEELDGRVEIAVEKTVAEAKEIMLKVAMSGGVKNGIPTGEPRADTFAMIDSIGGEAHVNGRGRIQGEYGYIHDAPYWTVFQEYGTRGRHGGRDNHPSRALSGGSGGILPLHAFIAATETVQRNLAANISDVNIWAAFR